MIIHNIKNGQNFDTNYQKGLLPQRNNKLLFYSDSSCRSNLSAYSLSSENRRILKKTNDFNYKKILLSEYYYNSEIQKNIHLWVKTLDWNFPTSSIKTVFTNHIFNYLYIWTKESKIVAYSICYFDESISHIAYVFYDPLYNHSDLPIRLVLQVVTDSKAQNLKYCYLGRFSKTSGYYKRNMPGFEYFSDSLWIKH